MIFNWIFSSNDESKEIEYYTIAFYRITSYIFIKHIL